MPFEVHLRHLKQQVKRTVCSRPGCLARRTRFPNLLSAPWRAPNLNLARAGALGDVLLCTPALKELKRSNPACYIRFFTDFPLLVRGLSYIDEVHPFHGAPKGTHFLGYEGCTPPRGHLARIIGDQIGLKVTDVRPDCVIDDRLVEGYRAFFKDFPRPHCVVLRRAGHWTPNKNWPDESWNRTIKDLSRNGTVVEIGAAGDGTAGDYGSYADLRDRTTIPQLIALICAADIYIGPCSGPMHIAAAVGTPRVVIYGGYEHPMGHQGYEYLNEGEVRTQVSLYSPVACAPCWRTDECPHGRKCLSMIQPDQVIDAIRDLLKGM